MTWRRALLGLALAFIGMQWFQPQAPRPSLPGHGEMSDFVDVPDHVEALLREACYDCHSSEVRWPWYARVSPISWWLVDDVEHGRSNLDFSRWSTNSAVEPTPLQRLTWMCRDIREAVMPPKLYRLAHPRSRMTEPEKEAICLWTEAAVRALR